VHRKRSLSTLVRQEGSRQKPRAIKMLSNRAKDRLNDLATDPNFRLRTQGDSIFADAPGYRSRRVSLRGELQPAGLFLQNDLGVVFPRRGIDATRRTYFRGSSEYAQT